ncbi:hypothetical protein [Herbiconiux solani]|nr:hypothetical protein [Herbiconiux solani]
MSMLTSWIDAEVSIRWHAWRAERLHKLHQRHLDRLRSAMQRARTHLENR